MNRPTRNLLFDVAFALTGVGTALLGATLPATLNQWQLSDANGGLLLLGGWGGSTSGALLARGRLARSAGGGLALTAIALFVLSQHRPGPLLLLYFIYGLGLGVTMTAISILRAREGSSKNADLILNRLNLLWAAGACLSPALALHSLRMLSVAALYRGIGTAFALAALAVVCCSSSVDLHGSEARSAPTPIQTWAPLRFGFFAAASVGLESALGSWLTTYAERSASGVTAAVSANSAFWLGLLLSRAAHSVKTAPWLHSRVIRGLHVAAVGLAVTLLLVFPNHSIIPGAGFVCGFGLGPLYPYILSITLPRYRSTAIFVIAGVGASVVPWLTGALSSAGGSLRVGLLVPAMTFIVLLITTFLIARSEAALPAQAIH